MILRKGGRNYYPSVSYQNDIDRTLAERSFYEFVKQAFENVPTLNKGMEYSDNWHIEFLCNKIQDRIERLSRGEHCKGMIVNIPPGSMKSIICTVAPAAWAWLKFPNFAHMAVSNADALSTNHCMQTRDIILSDWYRNNWGERIKLRSDENQKTLFRNTNGGMRYSAGIGGTFTGFHFHMVSIDDPISPDKADSETERNSANTTITEKILSRHINPESFFVLVIMQRVHDNDPTGFLVREQPNNWELIQLPADNSADIIPDTLADKYTDGLLFQSRFPRETLDEKRSQMTEANYRTQYLQSPSSATGNLIQVEFFNTYDRSELPPDAVVNFYVDLSFGKDSFKRASAGSVDYNVVLGATHHEGRLYITSRKKDKETSPEWRKSLMPFLSENDYNPDQSFLFIEPKAAGISQIQELNTGVDGEDGRVFLNVRSLPLPRNSSNDEMSKQSRITAQLAKLESGKCFLPSGNTSYRMPSGRIIQVQAWCPDFLETLRRFPKGVHDDDVDTFEMALRRELGRKIGW
jgi:hypothetical protein